jgi:steroid delta-isomerase-like uncharacterized protein
MSVRAGDRTDAREPAQEIVRSMTMQSSGEGPVRFGRAAIAFLVVATLVATGSCRQRPSDARDAERNKALVSRWIEEGFNQRNLTVVDELFAEAFAVNGQVIGRDGVKRNMSRHLDGFPDLHVTIDEMLAEGQKVGMWYTVEGTHRGTFEKIPPTGNHVKWVGFDSFGMEQGKIANARFLSDYHGLLTQLGASVSLPGPQERIRP